MAMAKTAMRGTVVEDPPVAQLLFSSTAMAWVWLIARLYVGYEWVDASMHKITNPAWVQTGAAVKGFWSAALTAPGGQHPVIAYGWYRAFIRYLLATHSYTWMGKLVAYGELVLGIALLLGIFVGVSAFFGALMNWNYMMAGTASTNPVLLVLAILLMLAWKTAGYIGLDYYLLSLLGTPWRPGRLFGVPPKTAKPLAA
jgi:thiosulfate dehydrogenase (quinone) large subunit